jgi:hypothetical protein
VENTDPNIEEKLVPFVEGALAEADRREVLAALPGQPALNQEVRLLRETISSLRMMAAKGLTYQSPVEIQSEQVVDFALQGEQWSRQATRQFQLHLLESPDVAEEIAILRELEGELQQRVESSATVPEMPASLRQAFQESYGRAPSEPAWKKSLVAVAAWLATLNIKVAAAAAAGLAVVVGGIGLGRYAHNQVQGSASKVAIASPSGAPTPVGSSTPTSPAPAGQVALLPSKVLPEELPRISRLLWQKQVSHSYRDGQIFVAQADLDRAWAALSVNEKVASAQPLKTGPAPADKKTNLLDGIIGALPDTKAPSPAATSKPEPAKDSKTTAGNKPAAAIPAVAIALPSEPAPSGAYANYQVQQSQAPAQPTYQAAEPARETREESRVNEPKAAPPSSQTEPVRHSPPPLPEAQRGEVKAPAAPSPRKKIAIPPQKAQARSTVLGQVRNSPPANTAPAILEQEIAVAPIPQPMPPAPPVDALRKPTVSTPYHYQQAENKGSQGAPQETTGKVSPGAVNLKVEIKDEEDPPGPAPQQVALEAPKVKPSTQPPDGIAGGFPGSQRAEGDRDVDFNRRPKPGAAITTNSGGEGFRARSDNFEVSADAPFEVAMLPVAKKLVEDSIGEAKVQMERKEDNHLLVTIRPSRNLTPQEIEKLRKLVREKLQLADEDTVVIRQP